MKNGSTSGRGPFGQVAMKKGYVTQQQLIEALAHQQELLRNASPHKLIGMIMLDMGALGTTELIEILRELNAPTTKTERRTLGPSS